VRKVEIEERARWHRGLVGEGWGIGFAYLAIQILGMCLCKINQQEIQSSSGLAEHTFLVVSMLMQLVVGS